MSYKLIYGWDGVLRIRDNASVPNDSRNGDWQEYQRFLQAGNTPEPADEPTLEELARQEEIRQAPLTARQWLTDNPQAKQIFSLSVSDLNSQITALVDASFPLLTAGQRTTWRLLLMAVLLSVRVLVKRELE